MAEVSGGISSLASIHPRRPPASRREASVGPARQSWLRPRRGRVLATISIKASPWLRLPPALSWTFNALRHLHCVSLAEIQSTGDLFQHPVTHAIRDGGLWPPVQRPIGCRCQTGHSFKGAGEVALIREAGIQTNVNKGTG